MQCFDAQQRTHAREQLRLIDRLRQKVVRAGLDAVDALLVRIERRDHDDGQKGSRGIGANPLAHFITGQTRHHHVQQHDVRYFGGHLRERFFAVRGRRHCVALDGQQIAQQLDVERRVVDHEDLGGFVHRSFLARMPRTASRNSLRLIGLPT